MSSEIVFVGLVAGLFDRLNVGLISVSFFSDCVLLLVCRRTRWIFYLFMIFSSSYNRVYMSRHWRAFMAAGCPGCARGARLCVCVCACVRACVRACHKCVCVCVCETEREREMMRMMTRVSGVCV